MKPDATKLLLIALVAGALGLLAAWLYPPAALDGWRIWWQGLASRSLPPPPAGTPIARYGAPIPPLQLARLDGHSVALPGDYAGRPLLINFWASWCGPCVQEMPELQRFASEQPAGGVQVVGIALDDKVAVETFLQRVPVSYPILLDVAGPADSSVRMGNGKGLLPYTVLIDATGRLQRQKLGPFAAGEVEAWVERQ